MYDFSIKFSTSRLWKKDDATDANSTSQTGKQ